jgi:hypothetical protein
VDGRAKLSVQSATGRCPNLSRELVCDICVPNECAYRDDQVYEERMEEEVLTSRGIVPLAKHSNQGKGHQPVPR